MSVKAEEARRASSQAEGILRELGFGAHETSVILSLMKFESATVAEISSDTGIHHANLYQVLENLELKGLVFSSDGRPKVFQFAPLSHFKDLFSSKLDLLIENLELLQLQRKSGGETPTLIYTIRGKDDVLLKIKGMLTRTNERLLAVIPSRSSSASEILEEINHVADKVRQVRVILDKRTDSIHERIQQRIKEDALAINFVIDGRESLISMPDLSVCGWTDNPLISMQFEAFLIQSWDLARNE